MADNPLTGLYNAKIGPTPRNALMGYVADALGAVNDYAQRPDRSMPMGKANPVLSALANALGVGDFAAVADRQSYGLPQTQGTGFARQMLPETRNVAAGLFPGAVLKPATAAKMAVNALANGMDAGALQHAAMVWHGSPHKFDKFDASKIGTGEGAQAYGHGLYLAESPEVAKQYAGDLAAARALRPIGNVDLATAYQNMPSDVPQSLLAARRDFRALNDMGELSLSDRRDFLEAVRNNIVGAQSGALYKVDLPDPMIARMLDWDKPLSQQAVPRSLVNRIGSHPDNLRTMPTDPTGQEFVQAMQRYFRNTTAGADELRQAGIPGIRYLDGGSRGAGAGTSNFVVFPGEESALRILERNGQPVR